MKKGDKVRLLSAVLGNGTGITGRRYVQNLKRIFQEEGGVVEVKYASDKLLILNGGYQWFPLKYFEKVDSDDNA